MEHYLKQFHILKDVFKAARATRAIRWKAAKILHDAACDNVEDNRDEDEEDSIGGVSRDGMRRAQPEQRTGGLLNNKVTNRQQKCA